MKNSITALLAWLLINLTGCASMIPAASTELEIGKYRIVTHGNSFAKPDNLRAKIDKKAIKLCGEGNYAYKTKRGLFETVKTPTYVNGSLMDIYSYQLTRVIYCSHYVGSDRGALNSNHPVWAE